MNGITRGLLFSSLWKVHRYDFIVQIEKTIQEVAIFWVLL